MLTKLLENPGLSKKEQGEIIRKAEQEDIKTHPNELKREIEDNYEKLKPILLGHWKYSINLILGLANRHLIVDYIEGRSNYPLIDLLVQLQTNINEANIKYFLKRYQRFQDIWKYLVLLQVSSQFYSKYLTEASLGWFLAEFVRISAMTIHLYLNIRNQPTKSSQDRIEGDLIIVSNCQKWVSSFYINLLDHLKPPQSQNSKKAVLSALSQISGALQQAQREGNLKSEYLKSIQDALFTYSAKGFTLEEIINIYESRLIQKGFANAVVKVEVPGQYDTHTDLVTQGVCWLVTQYLEHNNLTYSNQKQLSYLLLILGEIVASPYKLKQKIVNSVKKLLQEVEYSPKIRLGYPIGLLLFNIYTYIPEEFDYFSNKLGFKENKAEKLIHLRYLLRLKLDKNSLQKTTFILKSLTQEDSNLPEVLVLIKSLDFSSISENTGNILIAVLQQVLKAQKELAAKIFREKLTQQRALKNNDSLCERVSKLLPK